MSEVALEVGNQWANHYLNRNEEYSSWVEATDDGLLDFLPDDGLGAEDYAMNVADVYEDYADWTDSKRCAQFRELLRNQHKEEAQLHRGILELQSRHNSNVLKAQHIHKQLSKKEHELCLNIWKSVTV